MPSPHPPQAQGAQVCLPCGLKGAIPGYEAAMTGHVSSRDRISKSLDRPFSAVSRAVSFMFRGVGEPTWSLALLLRVAMLADALLGERARLGE